MPKDYAKISTSKGKKLPKRKNKNKSKGKKRNLHLKVWFVFIVFVSLFVFALNKVEKSYSKKSNNNVIVVRKHHSKIKKSIGNIKKNKIHFDFYTLLKNEKVPVNIENKNSGSSYFLQVASLKKYADADRLKASLALLGFEAHIEKKSTGRSLWNVVMLGPYTSKRFALFDKKDLKKNNISSILIKSEK